MTDETETKEVPRKPRIVVDYLPGKRVGRWSSVFHIFDLGDRQISLSQKDAVQVAKDIIRIARKGG